MKTRVTARLMLISPAGRLALMRVPGFAGGRVWVTFGGRLEPGESVLTCAVREGAEETGRDDVSLGQILFVRETTKLIEGEPTALTETFFAASLPDEALTHDGWTDDEKAKIDAVRWWSLEDLRATDEQVQPRRLIEVFAQLLEARR